MARVWLLSMIRWPELGPIAVVGWPEIGRQFEATSTGMIVPIPKSSRGEKFCRCITSRCLDVSRTGRDGAEAQKSGCRPARRGEPGEHADGIAVIEPTR